MATIDILLIEEDLLVEIFSYYIRSEGQMEFLRNIPRVCKAWNKISKKSELWKDVLTDNWSYLLNLSRRGLLCHTQSVQIDNYHERASIANLPAVLENIRDLKALDLNGGTVRGNSIKIVTEHCPHLERFCLSILELTSSHEWDQFLTVCGPTLKDLDLSYRCTGETEQQLLSEIAAKCPRLQRLVFFTDIAQFPIYELRSGCPRLEELKFCGCDLITDGRNDLSGSGFKELKKFSATSNDFGSLDVYELLKDSTQLEHLELLHNKDLISGNIPKIPSDKVRILNIRLIDKDSKALGDAVWKWRRTLSMLNLRKWKGDINCVLQYLLHDNPNPQLQTLADNINLQFCEKFLQKCENSSHLEIESKVYEGEEKMKAILETLKGDI